MGGNSRETDRAQAFTLEAVVAAVVVLVSLLFALQVAGVTSLSASTSNQQVVDQQEAVAAGVLDRAAADGSLRAMLLYWDDANGSFHGTALNEIDYTTGPPTVFGALLNETLDDRSVAFNVDVRYVEGDGVKRRPVIRYGQPSDDASRATRTVTLYDDDRLLFANGTRTGTTLANASSFYAPDRYAGPTYNVVRVEVVVWRV